MQHENFMRQALIEAGQAEAEREFPTGCVIVDPRRGVIASAHNQRVHLTDRPIPAEKIALNPGTGRFPRYTLQSLNAA